MKYVFEDTEAFKILARRAAEAEARHAESLASRPTRPDFARANRMERLLADVSLYWTGINRAA